MAHKVYTKKGDKGYTSVLGTRERFVKYHPRLEAVGTIDELNSNVGMLRCLTREEIELTDFLKKEASDEQGLFNVLNRVQNDLFSIGASLADVRDEKDPIDIDVSVLEKSMDKLSQSLEPLKNFILPAGSKSICQCHITRTVTRRAERTLVMLNDVESIDINILKYINRLSDYFFVLARYLAFKFQMQETIWKK